MQAKAATSADAFRLRRNRLMKRQQRQVRYLLLRSTLLLALFLLSLINVGLA